MELPDDWIAFMDSFIELESDKDTESFNSLFFFGDYMYISWMPYDENNQIAFPKYSVNGHSYYNNRIDLEYVGTSNEYHLEGTIQGE